MQKIQRNPWQKYGPWIIAILVVLLFVWAFSGIPLSTVKPQAMQVTKSIIHGLFHPDWSYVYSEIGRASCRERV